VAFSSIGASGPGHLSPAPVGSSVYGHYRGPLFVTLILKYFLLGHLVRSKTQIHRTLDFAENVGLPCRALDGAPVPDGSGHRGKLGKAPWSCGRRPPHIPRRDRPPHGCTFRGPSPGGLAGRSYGNAPVPAPWLRRCTRRRSVKGSPRRTAAA
jgi:hypothetical protein